MDSKESSQKDIVPRESKTFFVAVFVSTKIKFEYPK